MGRDRSGGQRVGGRHLPKQRHHIWIRHWPALRLCHDSSLQSPNPAHDGWMGYPGPVRKAGDPIPATQLLGVPQRQHSWLPTPLVGAVHSQPGTGYRRCVQPQPPPVLRALRLPLAHGNH